MTVIAHWLVSLVADSSSLAYHLHPTLEMLIPSKVESIHLGCIEKNTIKVTNLAQEPNTMTKGLGSKLKLSINPDCQCCFK